MYCYADRNRKNDLTSWQIIKVIDEAHDMGGNLALTGGDIFAFPDWKEVIRKVGQYGFTPLLSTKIPLKSLELNSCSFHWILYFPLHYRQWYV